MWSGDEGEGLVGREKTLSPTHIPPPLIPNHSLKSIEEVTTEERIDAWWEEVG